VPHLCGHYPDQLCGKCSGLDRNVKTEKRRRCFSKEAFCAFLYVQKVFLCCEVA
jgi:hypothetical protein